MATIRSSSISGKVRIVTVDTNPSAGAGTDLPVGTFAFCETGGIFEKTGSLATDWKIVSTVPISITRTALQTLISTSALVVGATYFITDAQDALGGTVSVRATSTNTINGSGIWTFTGKLPAQGRFKLATGVAGSVDQINVVMPAGAQNLLSAPVPFNTTRNQTATDVVAAVNANTATTGCRAFVTTSTTLAGNFDTPIIHIEAVETTTSFAHTMIVTVTTLTISNQINPTLGFTPSTIELETLYDITNDRILSAYDSRRDCLISMSLARITALTYNPVTTFRWGDNRFLGIKFIDSGYRNVAFRHGATVIWKSVVLTQTSISQAIFTTTALINVSLSSSSVSNVNSLAGIAINNSICILSISNIDIGSLNIVSQTSGGITLTNCTFGTVTTPSTLNLGAGDSNVSLTSISTTTTFVQVIQRNHGNSITLSTMTLGRITIFRNKLANPVLITGNTGIGNLNIEQNDIFGDVNITSNAFSGDLSIVRNSIGDAFAYVSPPGFGISIDGSTIDQLYFQDSSLTMELPLASNIGVLQVVNSTLGPFVLFPLIVSGNNIAIDDSIINAVDFNGIEDSFYVNNCTLNSVFFNANIGGYKFFYVELTNSTIISSTLTIHDYNTLTADNIVYISDSYWANNVTVQFGGAPVLINLVKTRFTDTSAIQLFLDGTGLAIQFDLTNVTVEGREFLAYAYDQIVITDYYQRNSNFRNIVPASEAPPNRLTFTTVTLIDADLEFIHGGTGQDLVLMNFHFEQQKLIQTDLTNSIIVGYAPDFAAPFGKTSIINGVYHYKSPKLVGGTLGGGPFNMNYAFKGFVFKKATFSSDQLVDAPAGVVSLGTAATPTLYLNLAGATINAAATIETGTLVTRHATGDLMQLKFNSSNGIAEFDVEGLIQTMEI